MKVNKLVFLPLLLSIIVSMNLVTEMAAYVKRGMALLTLGMVLWFIYNHLKQPVLPGKIIIVLLLVTMTSVLLILLTLIKVGW